MNNVVRLDEYRETATPLQVAQDREVWQAEIRKTDLLWAIGIWAITCAAMCGLLVMLKAFGVL